MNTNKNRGMSGAPFLIFIAIILGSLWFMGRMQQQGQEITYSSFVEAVEDNEIDEVYITQNKTAPTGVVSVSLKNSDSVQQVYVSDVNEVQKLLQENDIVYHMGNIKEDSWITTAVVPSLIVVRRDFSLVYADEPSAGRRKCKGNELWKEPGENERSG